MDAGEQPGDDGIVLRHSTAIAPCPGAGRISSTISTCRPAGTNRWPSRSSPPWPAPNPPATGLRRVCANGSGYCREFPRSRRSCRRSRICTCRRGLDVATAAPMGRPASPPGRFETSTSEESRARGWRQRPDRRVDRSEDLSNCGRRRELFPQVRASSSSLVKRPRSRRVRKAQIKPFVAGGLNNLDLDAQLSVRGPEFFGYDPGLSERQIAPAASENNAVHEFQRIRTKNDLHAKAKFGAHRRAGRSLQPAERQARGLEHSSRHETHDDGAARKQTLPHGRQSFVRNG